MATKASDKGRALAVPLRSPLALGCAALALLAPAPGESQTADPGLGLVGLPYANYVEQAAARANQRAASGILGWPSERLAIATARLYIARRLPWLAAA